MIARSLVAVALAALLGASPHAGVSGAGAGQRRRRVRGAGARYFADSFRAAPAYATQVGVHDYDAQLGSLSAADYAAELARDRSSSTSLATIDPASLSRAGRSTGACSRTR